MKLREKRNRKKEKRGRKRKTRENLRTITALSLAKKLRFITHDSSAH